MENKTEEEPSNDIYMEDEEQDTASFFIYDDLSRKLHDYFPGKLCVKTLQKD